MTYVAIKLSNKDHTKSGFTTMEEAQDYVSSYACNSCANDLKRGHVIYEWDGQQDKEPVQNILDTACGAEWLIVKEEDYDKAKDLPDLFIAAGMTPADRKTQEWLGSEERKRMQNAK
jgi:hypothetical protein